MISIFIDKILPMSWQLHSLTSAPVTLFSSLPQSLTLLVSLDFVISYCYRLPLSNFPVHPSSTLTPRILKPLKSITFHGLSSLPSRLRQSRFYYHINFLSCSLHSLAISHYTVSTLLGQGFPGRFSFSLVPASV